MSFGERALRVREVVRPTTWIDASRLGDRFGASIWLASETFQHTGSFKFRAAYHVAARVAQPRLITASSGNFGQALACACQMLGKSCVVVMPDTSAQVKIEAVRAYGGRVELIDLRQISRKARVQELALEDAEAYVASAYDDPLVIEGNATLGAELAASKQQFDFVVAPVGGGGLAAGIITGLRSEGSRIPVIGVEPLLANDAARSLRAGQLLTNESEPLTLADGVRTVSLGVHTWPVLRGGLARMVEVSEASIREAVRLLFGLANLKAEPTGALSISALLTEPAFFQNRRVCCVISGGNVDPEVYRDILEELRVES